MATNNNNKSNNKKPKVNIDGPRLSGTNDLPRDKLLKLVTRGLGHPVRETLLIWNWESEPVISVVFSMDPGRNRIKSSHFVLQGIFYDSAVRAEKVCYNAYPFIFVDVMIYVYDYDLWLLARYATMLILSSFRCYDLWLWFMIMI